MSNRKVKPLILNYEAPRGNRSASIRSSLAVSSCSILLIIIGEVAHYYGHSSDDPFLIVAALIWMTGIVWLLYRKDFRSASFTAIAFAIAAVIALLAPSLNRTTDY